VTYNNNFRNTESNKSINIPEDCVKKFSPTGKEGATFNVLMACLLHSSGPGDLTYGTNFADV